MKAPRSWPNSSLSSSVSGIAAQLTATNGPLARGASSWRARATSSLPVPVSPWISTEAGVGAARLDQPMHLLHRFAVADQATDPPDIFEPPAKDRDLLKGLRLVERLLDEQPESIHVDGLGQIVVGAFAHGRDGAVDGGEPGQDDDRHPGQFPLERVHQPEPVDIRHYEVRDHEGRTGDRDLLEGFLSLSGDFYLISPAREDGLERGARILLIVDDED